MEKIEINGKKYLLDTERAKELFVLREIEKFQVGAQVCSGLDGCDKYIVAHVKSHEIALINIKTGDRWVEPVIVADHRNITKHEWVQITGGGPQAFSILT